MFYSLHINKDGILSTVGTHYKTAPSPIDCPEGHTLLIVNKRYDDLHTGMKYDAESNSFSLFDDEGAVIKTVIIDDL